MDPYGSIWIHMDPCDSCVGLMCPRMCSILSILTLCQTLLQGVKNVTTRPMVSLQHKLVKICCIHFRRQGTISVAKDSGLTEPGQPAWASLGSSSGSSSGSSGISMAAISWVPQRSWTRHRQTTRTTLLSLVIWSLSHYTTNDEGELCRMKCSSCIKPNR